MNDLLSDGLCGAGITAAFDTQKEYDYADMIKKFRALTDME